MMTSSNGTFSVLVVRCVGNSPVNGEFPSKRAVTRRFDVSFICAWIKCSVNNRKAGDLRRRRAQYDVTVMWIQGNMQTVIIYRSIYIIKVYKQKQESPATISSVLKNRVGVGNVEKQTCLTTHLLSIECADRPKLYNMFKTRDACVWQSEFPIGFPFEVSALNSLFIIFHDVARIESRCMIKANLVLLVCELYRFFIGKIALALKRSCNFLALNRTNLQTTKACFSTYSMAPNRARAISHEPWNVPLDHYST